MSELDEISKTLGAATSVTLSEKKELAPVTPDASKATEDYNFARDNLKDMVEQAMEALPQMIRLMNEAQSDKMYNAAAAMMNTLSELNLKLAKLSREQKESHKPVVGNVPVTSTTNIAFIGSTEDYLKQLKRSREPVVIDGECERSE